MRFIVFGAGAIGGVIGGRLFEHGHDVTLVARGPHGQAMRDHGLRIESPDRTLTLRVPVVERPDELVLGPKDTVVMTVKSQDTPTAVRALADIVPPRTPVVCGQNGVANERFALRHFAAVYGVSVMCPSVHLTPGVVQAYASPISGVLDIGRYPRGTDDVAGEIAAALRSSGFSSRLVEDITKVKYGKLLSNLGNAIEAVCGPGARRGSIDELAQREAISCFEAAGIEYLAERDPARLEVVKPHSIGGQHREGGSSWQSLQRRTGTVESDYLNGEIVLLGRLHEVPTPVNELLQVLANRMARERQRPGILSEREFFQLLRDNGYGAER